MAQNVFQVNLIKYNFTASVVQTQPITVGINTQTIRVIVPANTIVTATQVVQNVEVIQNGIASVLAPSVSTVDEFIGDGVTTLFQLSKPVLGQDFVEVTVGGVVQTPDVSYTVYSVTATNTTTSYILFTDAPPAPIYPGLIPPVSWTPNPNITARYYSVLVAREIQGPQGRQGSQGRQGIQGAQGRQGMDGAYAGMGYQGVQGAQGAQGRQGLIGVQGAQGRQGIPGAWPGSIWSSDNKFLKVGNVAEGTGDITLAKLGIYNVTDINSNIIIGAYVQSNPNEGDIETTPNNIISIGNGTWNRSSTGSVSIGYYSGYGSNKNQYSVSIGYEAGDKLGDQGFGAISIGRDADGGDYSVNIGYEAAAGGDSNSGNYAVSIGYVSQASQNSVAIGRDTISNSNSVSVGAYAQASVANSIVINATGSNLIANSSGMFVKPIRHVTTGSLPSGFYNMAYNPTTGEIIYWS